MRPQGFKNKATVATATGRETRRKAATWNIVGFSRSDIKPSPTGSAFASRLPTGVTGITTDRCQHNPRRMQQ